MRLQNEDSLDRYIAYLKRFACYLLRVYMAQKERAVLKSDVDSSDVAALVDDNKEITIDRIKDRGEEQQAANSEQVDRIEDCCELTVFSTEQKLLIEDML